MSWFPNFIRFADTNGDGTGDANAIGDYSSTVTDFLISHPASAPTNLFINRLIVHIEDTNNWSADNYGNLSGPLTNGISILKLDGNLQVSQTVTEADPIKSNAHWGKFCYDVNLVSFGSGNDFFQVRWTLAKSGYPARLAPGESFAVRLNDDFTGLVQHTFNFQGWKQ